MHKSVKLLALLCLFQLTIAQSGLADFPVEGKLIKLSSTQCDGCVLGSTGPCKSVYNVCYSEVSLGVCPTGTVACSGGSSNGSNSSNTTNGSNTSNGSSNQSNGSTGQDSCNRNYAPGVNPFPSCYGSKTLWFYACKSSFGLACGYDGGSQFPSVAEIIATKVNLVNMISGISVTDSNQASWFTGQIAGSCGGTQVPLPFSVDELRQLHNAGITIMMSLGGWCYDFPLTAWGDAQVTTFVDQFEKIRNQYGGYIDGIDFDWEGFCQGHCLADYCVCGWGSTWSKDWTMVNQGTVSTMNKISAEMRRRGFIVTLVPMSSQIYSSSNLAANNELVKYNIQLSNFDGLMTQWYTGSALSICSGKQALNQGGCGCTNTATVQSWLCPERCPRQLDCPDWSYSGESDYESQIRSIKVLETIGLNVEKQLAIGLEFYKGTEQWGPKPDAAKVKGLDDALKAQGYKNGMAGVGGWTLGGTAENPTYTANGFIQLISQSQNWGNQLTRCQPAGKCY